MSHLPLFLRGVLLLDAVTCVAMGALLILAAEPIGALTAIPVALSFYAGVALVPIAAFIAFVARAGTPAAVRVVVAGNALWVVGSVWLIVSDAIGPNALGVAFIVVQAVAVAALAALEARGLPRTRTAASAA